MVEGGKVGSKTLKLAICSIIDKNSHSGPTYTIARAKVDVGGSLIPHGLTGPAKGSL